MLLFGISTAYIFTVMQCLLGGHDPTSSSYGLMRDREPISAPEKIYSLADALG